MPPVPPAATAAEPQVVSYYETDTRGAIQQMIFSKADAGIAYYQNEKTPQTGGGGMFGCCCMAPAEA